MKDILFVVIGLVITSIVLLLCFCFYFLASISDEYWDNLKIQLEKRNGRK
jgi:hypothetical protein